MVAFEFHGWICSGAARCSTVLTSLARPRRWALARLADNFRSLRAARAWAWGYVPLVGGASAWHSLVFLMIAHFVASCVEQFAQSQATFEHNAAILAEARRLQAAHATTNSR